MSALTARFHRGRWSPERKLIDGMGPGHVVIFTEAQYNNAKTSVDRLNEAYDGERKWSAKHKTTATGRQITVTRDK